MPATSNLPEVLDAVRRIPAALDLTRDYRGRPLGNVAMDLIAGRIRERTVDRQQAPGGAALTPLAEATLDRKARLGYPPTIGVETGSMLGLDQLRGEQAVAPDQATMTYGTDDRDRQVATWFQQGTARGQPPRPFYEADEADYRALDALFDAALAEWADAAESA